MKPTVGLIVAGVLLFAASLNDPFHFDDELIRIDSNVTTPARWAHFFNPFYLRQFTFFTFYLNHLAGGLNPAGYHAVNVLIHIANAVLLFLLLRRFVEPWVAGMAAALFLVHPVQTEAVLYVYQRSILLACFFSLLALIALANRRIGWAVLAFLLAFESKESALAVPLVVALFLVPQRWREIGDGHATKAPSDRSLTSRRLVVWLAAVVSVLALAAFALGLLADEKTVGLNTGVRPLQYLLTQTRVVYTYLRLLVFPYPQSLEYEFPNAGGIWTVTGILLILIAGWRWKSLSILAFFILLAPTSSVIPSADAAFEHRLYLPMLAVSLFVAYLMSKIPWRRSWVAAGVLAVLAILTVRREAVWSSDIALWEDTSRRAPGKARVWFNLGGAYLNNDPAKARAAFLRALELQPHWPEALYDLGLIEQGKKNWSGALAYYQQALAQDPKYWPACNNIGNTLFAMGEGQRSVEFFERTLSLNPDYWPAQYNIAIVDFMGGRYRSATKRLRTVLDWRPDFYEARSLLATSLIRSGEQSLADQELKKLSEMNAAESRNTPTMILAPNRP
jgi:tetratricopeptide (TPR) repeat protein